jgi:hypothetical protein
MGTEVLIALIAAVATIVAAAVGATPALVAFLRRTRVAVAEDGAATREALEAMGAVLHARIGDVRDDIDDVREDVARVREWQAWHDAAHLISESPPGGDAT